MNRYQLQNKSHDELRKRCADAGACPDALEWLDQHPDMDLREAWQTCPNAAWLGWYIDTIVGESAAEHFFATEKIAWKFHINCLYTLRDQRLPLPLAEIARTGLARTYRQMCIAGFEVVDCYKEPVDVES